MIGEMASDSKALLEGGAPYSCLIIIFVAAILSQICGQLLDCRRHRQLESICQGSLPTGRRDTTWESVDIGIVVLTIAQLHPVECREINIFITLVTRVHGGH